MSVQPPPTNTTTPVYNPIFYVNPTSSSGIDVAFLDANYLKFPTAQGSEDFTNGLFSSNTIDFNSSTGTDRAINGLSKSNFTDILGNTSYTSYIEENSTAIGSYNGGLVINSSNSINLVGTDVLLNGVPITSGGGDVFLAGNNTFTGTNTFDNQVLIDNTTLSFPNNGYIRWGNGTALLNFPSTIPNSSVASGLGMSWNNQPSNGEVDLICYGQGGQGGFAFYSITTTSTSPTLIANMFPNGIDFKQNITSNNTFTGQNNFNVGYINLQNITGSFPATPIGYSQFVSYNGNPWFSPTNGGGVQMTTSNTLTTTLLNYALLASPTFTGTPSAPTATSGTNTTQIATTAFVQSAVSSTTSNSFTLTLTPVLNPITNSTNWTTNTIIPSATLSSNVFTFSYYTNITNTNVTTSGTVSPSGNFVAGTGTAILQPVNTSYNTYLFNLVNNGGSMTVGSSGQVSPPSVTFAISDSGYFFNNSVNLVFKCLKIF